MCPLNLFSVKVGSRSRLSAKGNPWNLPPTACTGAFSVLFAPAVREPPAAVGNQSSQRRQAYTIIHNKTCMEHASKHWRKGDGWW